MNLRRSDLAMYRVREERRQVMESIAVYEAERWEGFLGGYKGICTFLVAAVVLSASAYIMGILFGIEALSALCLVWGISSGLILSQCVRNMKNANAETHLRELKANYAALTKMSTELYFA